MLKKDFLDMLYLFACGSTGRKANLDRMMDLESIFKQAQRQGVWALVFSAIEKSGQKDNLAVEREKYSAYQQKYVNQIMGNAKRQRALRPLFSALERAGIKYCILKGQGITHAYHQPSLRISGDTDLLIDGNDWEQVSGLLTELDYKIDPLLPNSPHYFSRNPAAGVVEVHKSLFTTSFSDDWLNGNSLQLGMEPYRTVPASDGTPVITLGYTDHLMYLILHCIKHFLKQGVGVRQLMDIVMYMRYHCYEIDWPKFNVLFHHPKYEKFISNLIGVGIEYFLIDAQELPACRYDMNILNKMLYDMQEGGLFGTEEEGREDLSLLLGPNRRKAPDKSRGRTSMLLTKYFRTIIPTIENLSVKYRYLKTKPWLYRVAIFQRIGDLIRDLFIGKKNMAAYRPREEVDTQLRRLKLMAELEMK